MVAALRVCESVRRGTLLALAVVSQLAGTEWHQLTGSYLARERCVACERERRASEDLCADLQLQDPIPAIPHPEFWLQISTPAIPHPEFRLRNSTASAVAIAEGTVAARFALALIFIVPFVRGAR